MAAEKLDGLYQIDLLRQIRRCSNRSRGPGNDPWDAVARGATKVRPNVAPGETTAKRVARDRARWLERTMRRLISAVTRRMFPPTQTLEGYSNPELVEVIFQKAKAFIPRDDWPEMDGVSSVLDFGGGCGQHYKLAQRQSPNIRWAVVETPEMVERASMLATDRLQFFTDLSQAKQWLGEIEVMHSNSALQYTPAPEQTLTQLCGLRASRMIWERLSLSDANLEREVQSSMLGDNGPRGTLPGLKEKIVKYTRIKIPEASFIRGHENYTLTDRGTDWFRFSLKELGRREGS
jgi:hypothetical protein